MKTRDLATEQTALRALLNCLPWLKLRRAAEARGLPYTTLTSYLRRPLEDAGFRHLRNEHHADIIWDILRQTAKAIAVELARLPKAKATAAGLLLVAMAGCAVRPPAGREDERPGPVRHALRQEPGPSRIR